MVEHTVLKQALLWTHSSPYLILTPPPSRKVRQRKELEEGRRFINVTQEFGDGVQVPIWSTLLLEPMILMTH